MCISIILICLFMLTDPYDNLSSHILLMGLPPIIQICRMDLSLLTVLLRRQSLFPHQLSLFHYLFKSHEDFPFLWWGETDFWNIQKQCWNFRSESGEGTQIIRFAEWNSHIFTQHCPNITKFLPVFRRINLSTVK